MPTRPGPPPSLVQIVVHGPAEPGLAGRLGEAAARAVPEAGWAREPRRRAELSVVRDKARKVRENGVQQGPQGEREWCATGPAG
jgi:hypothetical protein